MNFGVKKYICNLKADIVNNIDATIVTKIAKATAVNLMPTSVIVHPSGLAAVILIRVSSLACVIVKHLGLQE